MTVYLVLQIAEGGAYVLELATCDVLPLLDCSSKHFSSSLEYNKIKRGDILRGVEPIYVPDHLACPRYCFPNDSLVKGSLGSDGAYHIITDHVQGTAPVQKMSDLNTATDGERPRPQTKESLAIS